MDAVVPIPQSAGQATLGEVIAEAQRLLEQAGIESAGQEAFWIVEHVLRLPIHHVVADRDRLLSPAELLAVRGLIERRVGREPLHIADMLVGATCFVPLMAALLNQAAPDLKEVNAKIERLVASLFK